MTFKKSTRYALYAAMEMARAGADHQVTPNAVADRYAIKVTVLAKIFQQLVRCGIAISTRGVNGGYVLSRKASELTVLDVIEAFESPRSNGECLLVGEACAESTLCRLRTLLDEVDEMARCTYASVTLETLVGSRPAQDTGLRVLQ